MRPVPPRPRRPALRCGPDAFPHATRAPHSSGFADVRAPRSTVQIPRSGPAAACGRGSTTWITRMWHVSLDEVHYGLLLGRLLSQLGGTVHCVHGSATATLHPCGDRTRAAQPGLGPSGSTQPCRTNRDCQSLVIHSCRGADACRGGLVQPRHWRRARHQQSAGQPAEVRGL